jgi:hypothetical protein
MGDYVRLLFLSERVSQQMIIASFQFCVNALSEDRRRMTEIGSLYRGLPATAGRLRMARITED